MKADFNNQWIEIFAPGDYGAKGRFGAADVAAMVKNFKAGVWKPPAVFGHPETDSPAHGWARDMRVNERGFLEVQIEKETPQLVASVRDGRFPNRSIAIYLDPKGAGPVVRHIGFLGATPPEVKGLEPVQFSDGEFVAIEFREEEEMDKEQVQKTVLEAITSFFWEKFGGGNPPTATFSEEQVNQRIDAAVQKAVEATSAKFNEELKKRDEAGAAAQQTSLGARFDELVAGLRKAGRWVPAFDVHLPVLKQAALGIGSFEFTEGTGEKAVKKTASGFDAVKSFLEAIPQIVPLGELKTGRAESPKGKLVQFTEAKGIALDAGSVGLSERAEEITAELRKSRPKDPEHVLFGEALRQARTEMGGDAVGSIAAGAV